MDSSAFVTVKDVEGRISRSAGSRTHHPPLEVTTVQVGDPERSGGVHHYFTSARRA
jgi:hypothetical protein